MIYTFFLLISMRDIISTCVNRMTDMKITCQCDVKHHDVTNKYNNISFEGLHIRLATTLVIMSVSTFIAAVILCIWLKKHLISFCINHFQMPIKNVNCYNQIL